MIRKTILSFFLFVPSIALAIDPIQLYGPYIGNTSVSHDDAACLPISAVATPAGLSDIIHGFVAETTSDIGRVDLLSGRDGTTINFSRISTLAGDDFGKVVNPIGDVNNDSLNDFAVGLPQQNQVVTFISNINGYTTVPLNIVGITLSPAAQFGSTIVGLRQIYPGLPGKAIVVGAPLHIPVSTEDGLIAVFDPTFANPFIYSCVGLLGTDEHFGAALSTIPDINNDGFNDIIVGAPDSNFGDGRVVVISGGSGGSCTPIFNITTPPTSAGSFGSAVSSLPDMNGDGTADFIVGARQMTDISGTTVGQAVLFSGATGSPLCNIQPPGFRLIGNALSETGDINYDGFPDFLVGAFGRATNLPVVLGYSYNRTNGTCDLEFAKTLPLPAGNNPRMKISGQQFGEVCDMNGDKFAEFAVHIGVSDIAAPNHSFVYSIATPTPTPRPTAIPISASPKRSRLTYRISEAGSLRGEIVLDKDPKGQCTTSLLARYSNSDLTGVSAVRTLMRNRRAKRVHRFSASNLSHTMKAANGEHYILHMIAKHTCKKTRPFSSNVFSRYLTCGAMPEVTIETFMSQLRGVR